MRIFAKMIIFKYNYIYRKKEINMNSVVIVGRAGQDPDVKYFESGKVKTTFSVAVSRWDYKSKSEKRTSGLY